MRILHLSALYPPHVIGGAERSVETLAQAQVAAGHEVAVACTTPGPFAEERRAGVRVLRLPHGTRFWTEDWPRHGRASRAARKLALPFNARQAAGFGRAIDAVRPDLVHSHSMTDVATRLWPLAAARGVPVVHTLRDFDLLCATGDLHHGGDGCNLGCRLVSAPKRRHHRAIGAVAAVGSDILARHEAAGLFAHVPPSLRRVLGNGVATTPTSRAPCDGPLAFGFLGRVTEAKGVALLLDAVRRLPAVPPWSLTIAGEGDAATLARLRPLASGLPVAFVGRVPAPALLDRVDVLIVPSLWPEPFGRVVVEAYGAGVAVLGAATGALPDLVAGDPERWLFPVGDAAALAERLAAILAAGRPALPPPASFAGTLRAADPAAVERGYRALYDDLLATSRPAAP